MPDEARLADTGSGLTPHGDGWFVVNAFDAERSDELPWSG
jgi:hypothetical protein